MNMNYLSPVEFQLTIQRMPNIEFYVQRASIPSISTSPVGKPSPINRFYEQGDQVEYGEFNISFTIDEKMSNYLEVYNWLTGYSAPQSTDQYKKLKEDQYGLKSDISLLIVNSSKNPNINVKFYDCFPLNLSEVPLDTTSNDVVYPEANVSFRYNYFDISVK